MSRLRCEKLLLPPLGSSAGPVVEVTFSLPAQQNAVVVGADAALCARLMAAFTLQAPVRGLLHILGHHAAPLKGADKHALRRRMGVCAQKIEWVHNISLLDNVMLPLRVAGVPGRTARDQAHELLRWLGLSSVTGLLPHQLSAHQERLAAVARACIHKPSLLLLDEPFQLLGDDAQHKIWHMVQALHAQGSAVVLFTRQRSWLKRLNWPTFELSPQGLQPHAR